MPDTSSNAIWCAPQRPDCFESRAHRFREEMRPLFYLYLGIAPNSRVLDGGCGSGVFTRYLARGLASGHVTGFDINGDFIAYGRQKSAELGLDGQMTLQQADGFALPYADGSFDAVTNYTYLGVLSDPEAGLRELVRACRAGGVVSCVAATNNVLPAVFQGEYPFEDADELQRLADLEAVIFGHFARKASDWKQSEEWHAFRYPVLFARCGLQDIRLYPFGHLICYGDESYPQTYRRELALTQTREELAWLPHRYAGKEDIYARHGFCADDYRRLVQLLQRKLAYLESHFDTGGSFEWHGSFNFIVAGRKPAPAA